MSQSFEPVDRLTRICDAMGTTFHEHPEHTDRDRAIIFLDDGECGGISVHGYDDMNEAVADLIVHLRQMMHSMGKELDVMFLGDEGVDRI